MDRLETPRLVLRPWCAEDLEALHGCMANTHVAHAFNCRPHATLQASRDVLCSYMERNDTWAIACKENDRVVGQISLYPDENRGAFSRDGRAWFVNFALGESYWGQGYMTEALRCVVMYAFEQRGAAILTAFHFPENVRSRRVLEKCGFEYEITLDAGIRRFDGEMRPGVYHCIMAKKF